MEKHDKIYIAGHNGMVGSSIVRKLKREGFTNLITRSSKELNLINQADVLAFFEETKPDYVFMAAAKVGGIQANNTYKGDFLYDNLMIQTNVIHASHLNKVKKLLFLGSSCIYPKFAQQPISEDSLLTGTLEPTNEPYAIAKIAGIKLCDAYRDQHGCNFISAMPTNLYGPNDNYDLSNSHVLPAMIRKFHEAKLNGEKEVVVWGTGKPMREFLYVDDLADACFFLMENYDEAGAINVGTGFDITIEDLAHLVKKIVGFEGKIAFDTTKPDGTPKKQLNVAKINALGWKATIDLEQGIQRAYESFLNQ
ncbi:MAG: GDP-L-fucose synthase [Fluviicola sp.]|jgi:GDP-L-fucose synthase|uniref:GDP-L-fucose synthase n=1 Tax=Fluviicola sp. TaxID=1917219 RepID=UPI00263A09E8|nr:GDP-L-fucose synthase [Fluviicola sp.]MDF3027331.1 GDP-L-fucose synthase [Fluviicola sp.]